MPIRYDKATRMLWIDGKQHVDVSPDLYSFIAKLIEDRADAVMLLKAVLDEGGERLQRELSAATVARLNALGRSISGPGPGEG